MVSMHVHGEATRPGTVDGTVLDEMMATARFAVKSTKTSLPVKAKHW